jgi:glycine dehydrogenase subunit 1
MTNLPDPLETQHRYIPNASEDVREMLDVIGVDSVDRLFDTIPDDVKLDRLLDVPGPWSEIESRRWFRALAARNKTAADHASFLGGGAYAHYQPACIDQLLLRAEWLTAYTPYQPEVSQGTLQSIFEYQSHQCLLTGLDVANASLYDGSTALCEAVLLAERMHKNKHKVVIAKSVHPHYRDTVRTYIQNLGIELVEVSWGEDGRVDLDALHHAAEDGAFAIAVQSPNFFGVVEDYDAIAAATPGVTRIAVVAEATSLGILNPPGEHGFDICVGEGQAWGVPTQFGGPFVGFMVVRDTLKRHMPGRLVGETVDVDGRRAYVLTLATREQHIRRGKATSNICTNEALIALAANMYLSLLGKEGLREVALQSMQKAAYLRGQLREAKIEMPFSGPIYNEFLVRTPFPAAEILEDLEHENILGGIAIGDFYLAQANDFLVAVTELNTRHQMDQFVAALSAAIARERR